MSDDPKTLLERLSENLGLAYESQDWGIVNSDAQRLKEFINYYERTELKRTQAYHVFELILASFNDGLLEGSATKGDLRSFIAQHGNDFPDQVEYWRGLQNDEEFPIADALR